MIIIKNDERPASRISAYTMTDHLYGVAAILLAGLMGILPFVLTYALTQWGPL